MSFEFSDTHSQNEGEMNLTMDEDTMQLNRLVAAMRVDCGDMDEN